MSSSETPTFFEQLKRRRVIRVAIAYAAAAFVVLQVADLVFPALAISDAVYRVLVIVTLAGFPVALVLAWWFDLTPEGIRRATAKGETGALVARYRSLLMVGGGVAAVVAVAASVAIWARPRPASGAVAAGADVIAVLPFATRGDGVEVLGEGMVDLLSRNLDEVGAIRTVDPRVVLSRWSQRVEDGVVTFGQALELGRDVEAGSILWGSVTAVGANVRIAGDLHTVDGTRLASVEKDGSFDNVLAVVDSFSVALLREVWRSQEPVPQFNVAAITTGDPQAIRAYLQGERFYRSSSWDSAEVAFGRAVEADSTFALAHYRLVRTALWSGGGEESGNLARREAELAYRYVDRLPARERTLVLAEYLRLNGRDAEAQDTLQAYLERYPGDPEVLFWVVDDAYHERLEEGAIDQALQSTAAQVRPFDRVIRLDPTFTPALIHPLERSLAAGDTALFAHYIGLLEAAAPAETLAIRTYRTAFRALRQPEDTETLLQALALVVRQKIEEDLAWQARMAAVDPLTRALIFLPPESRRPAVDWLLSEWEGEAASPGHAIMALHVLLATGRLQQAGDLLMRPALRSTLRER
ncbi:MAG: tetratricopeptide repeat protein, partial [Planctomycetota bacterium]